MAIIASLVAASSIHVPYYAISPGKALPVAGLVKVADGVPSYPPKGSVYLCTVSLGRTTVLEALQGWLDPTTDVVKTQVIKPKSVNDSQLREINLQAMDTSKETALAVAFQQLGYHVITGTGAVIDAVVEGKPADGVLHAGDVIVAVDGTAVELHSDAVRLLGAHHPGDTVRLTVEPKGSTQRHDVSVRLAVHPDDPSRPLLGVTLRTRDQKFDFPYDVDIASDRIGGPSAGLAFTLEVLDVITKGELTGGIRVAATGTIDLDGTVGVIGGVAQKTVAVKEAGVKLFLVPKDELAQARRHAGKGLVVEPVENLQDALRILATFGGNGLALGKPGHGGA